MNKFLIWIFLLLPGCATQKVILKENLNSNSINAKSNQIILNFTDKRLFTNSIGSLSSGALNSMTPIEFEGSFIDFLSARLKSDLGKKMDPNQSLNASITIRNFWISEEASFLSGNGNTKCLVDYELVFFDGKKLTKSFEVKEYAPGVRNFGAESAAKSTLETCISAISNKIIDLNQKTK